MEQIKLSATIRDETGKNRVKKIRKQDFVPACLYKKGQKTVNLKVNKKALYQALHTKAGENVLIDLMLDEKSKKPRAVMIKEIQHHPVKDGVLHVDFNEISLTEVIKVNVPVVSKGKPEAVTKEGGTLEHIMWEVEIECLPTQIPEKIEVEVSSLKIGDKIFVKDLVVPLGVKILNDPQLALMSAEPPHVEKPAEEVPLEEEITEPEVIAKGKKEEEEEEEEAEEAPPKEAKKEEKKSKE